ncbi:hypothetical protein [Paenibacillus gorillae]|uniref:hypothetical protein n=1 Tax=Paenibacillus gorillae TaxID=1243662 RepID=UPI00138AD1C2|nr:hypothetical protein [Paenibacillus gorillae]
MKPMKPMKPAKSTKPTNAPLHRRLQHQNAKVHFDFAFFAQKAAQNANLQVDSASNADFRQNWPIQMHFYILMCVNGLFRRTKMHFRILFARRPGTSCRITSEHWESGIGSRLPFAGGKTAIRCAILKTRQDCIRTM